MKRFKNVLKWKVFRGRSILAMVLAIVVAATSIPAYTLPVKAALGSLANVDNLPTAPGSTLSAGIYKLESTVTITGNINANGGNALKVASGATVAIYIKKGVTLTVVGANADSINVGGAAAILVPSNSTLCIIGEGKLVAKGGNGYNASNGSDGNNATYNTKDHGSHYSGLIVKGGAGGNGGKGASGGGAAIGTNGGVGGKGGSCNYTERRLDGTRAAYEKDQKGTDGEAGANGGNSAQAGKIYIQSTVTVSPTAGNAGGRGAGGSGATTGLGLQHDGWRLDLTASPGGGGGGGGAAGAATAIGAGGPGGGGGGAGGAGAILYNAYNAGRYYATGKGGSGGNSSGLSGSTARSAMRINTFNGMKNFVYNEAVGSNWHDWYDHKTHSGGAGGAGGARGTSGGVQDYRNGLASNSTYFDCIRSVITLTSVERDGVNIPENSVKALYGYALPTIQIPTRTGYTFDGFNVDGVGQIYKANGTSSIIWNKKGDTTATAQWTPKNYTITFNRNGGSGVTNKVVTYGQEVSGLAAPIRAGYKFTGYYKGDTNVEDNKYFDDHMLYVKTGAKYKEANDITLNAGWTPIKYTINFYSDFGNGAEWVGAYDNVLGVDNRVTYGSFKLPGEEIFDDGTGNIHKKDHCNFIGWNMYDQQTWAMYTPGKNYSGGLCEVNDGSVSVYAAWEPQDMKTLIYNANGGTNVPDMAELYNDSEYSISFASANIPTRDGYTFVGWDESSVTKPEDCKYKLVDAQKGEIQLFAGTENNHILKNTFLYAIWKKNPTVTYHTNGGFGTLPEAASYKVDDPVTVDFTNVPAKTGYEFTGWNTAADGKGVSYTQGSEQQTFRMPEESVVLYAQYAKEKKTLSLTVPYFENNPVIVKTQSGTDTVGEVELEPLYDGADEASGEKLFNYSDPLKITVYAEEMLNSENIYALLGGSSLQFKKKADKEVISDKTYNVYELTLSNPVTDMDIEIKDIDYYVYNINYDLKGGTLTGAPENYTYGIGCSLEGVTPVKEGYKFVGWKLGETYITSISENQKGNVTLEASYKANTYDVEFRTGISTSLWPEANGNKTVEIIDVEYDTPFTVPTCKDWKITINGEDQNYGLLGFATNPSSSDPQILVGSQVSNLTPDDKTGRDADNPNMGKVIMYAIWSAPTCSLSYYADGGTGDVPASSTYPVGSTAKIDFSADSILTKEGFTFGGWKVYGNADSEIYRKPEPTSGEGTEESPYIYPDVTIDLTKDTVLVPNWVPLTYKVVYHGVEKINNSVDTKESGDINYDETFTLWNSEEGELSKSYDDSNDEYNKIDAGDNFDSSKEYYIASDSDSSVYEHVENVETFKTEHPSWDERKKFTYEGSRVESESDEVIVQGITYYEETVEGNIKEVDTSNIPTVPEGKTWFTINFIEAEENGSYSSNLFVKDETTYINVSEGYNETYKESHQGWKDLLYTKSTKIRTNHLIGWSNDADHANGKDDVVYATNQSVKNLIVPSESDTTADLYAIWSYDDDPAKFTYVVFDENGAADGSAPNTQIVQVASGEDWSITDEMVPDPREGYEFEGWYLGDDPSKTIKNALTGTELTAGGTLTLYAKWRPKEENLYTVTFGDKENPDNKAISDKIPLGEVANLNEIGKAKANWTREGYILSGWKTITEISSEEGEGREEVSTEENILTVVPMTKDITVYAVWKEDPAKWKSLVYNANGGSGFVPSSEKALIDATVTIKFDTVPTRVGYTFKGWSESPDATGTIYENKEGKNKITLNASKILYAVWEEVPTYSITYNMNIEGAENLVQPVDVTKYEKDAEVTVKFDPVAKRQGYSFLGWASTEDALSAAYTPAVLNEDGDVATEANDKFSITGDTDLYAVWKPITYSVVLHNGEDKYEGNDIKDIAYGDTTKYLPSFETTELTNPDSAKKEFAGWAVSEDGSVTYEDGAQINNFSLTDGGTVDLYAVWKNKKYTVTLNDNYDDCGEHESFDVEYQAGLTPVVIPTRDGYEFKGYFEENNQYYDGNGNPLLPMPANNLNLTAKWEKFTFTISFYDQKSNLIGTQAVGTQTSSPTLNTLERLGYELPSGKAFGWWECKGASTPLNLDDGDLISKLPTPDQNGGEIILQMSLVSDVEYVISYNANGGLGGPDRTFTYPEDAPERITIDYEDIPVRPGYTFMGWDRSSKKTDNPEFDYEDYDPDSPEKFRHPGKDKKSDKFTVLYAVWKPKEIKVTFESNGGTEIGPITISYGDELGQYVSSREKYKFEGWYTSPDFKARDYVDAETEMKSDEDVTLYAKWSRASVTVSFDSKGGSEIDPVEVNCGETYGNLTSPYKKDFIFGGWYLTEDCLDQELVDENDNVTAVENHTLHAKWIENKRGIPEIEASPETIFGKKDGILSGITSTMEISLDPENGFIAVGSEENTIGVYNENDGTISSLAAGTYYVRYAGTDNQSESEPATVTVGDGTKLNLNLPASNTSYTVTASETQLAYGANATITIDATHADAHKTYELTASNGSLVKVSEENRIYTYTISNVTEDVEINIIESTLGYEVAFVDEDGTETNEYVITYSGQRIKPLVHVYFAKKLLIEGVDYTITYKNNVKAGSIDQSGSKAPCVVIKGKGAYTKSYIKYFTIEPASLNDCTYERAIQVKAGVKVVPKIVYKGTSLTKADYDLESTVYVDDSSVLSVTGKGNFKDTIKIEMNKKQDNLRKMKVVVGKEKITFNGQAQYPRLTITDALTEKVLTENTDYVVSTQRDSVSAGKHTIVVMGIGKYTGTISKAYTINPVVIASPKVDGNLTAEYSPAGAYPKELKVFVPNPTGQEGDIELTYGKDYTLTYSKNKAVGSAKYTVKFVGNYKGTKPINGTFEITKGKISNAIVVVPDMIVTKTSGAFMSKPIVEYDGVQINPKMYTVKYYLDEACTQEMTKTSPMTLEGNSKKVYVKVAASTAKNVSLEGDVDCVATYTVSKSAAEQINLSKAKITLVTNKYTYDSHAKEPEIVVTAKIGKKKVVLEENQYSVTYVCNKGVGKASVVVNGNGVDTVGSKTASFSIGKMNLIDWFKILKK